MELYLKQDKYLTDAHLYFYNEHEELCFQTSRGLAAAKQGLQILNKNHDVLIELQRKSYNYELKLTNGGTLNVRTPNFFSKKIRIANKLFSLEKTKRKTMIFRTDDSIIMEFARKKAPTGTYTKISVFDEKLLPIALAVVTAACCTSYQEEYLLRHAMMIIF